MGKKLFFSFSGGSLQHSGDASPFVWSVVTGAAELAMGDDITAVIEMISDALIIFTRQRTFVLYGSGTSDWDLRVASRDTGAIEWTAQKIGDIRYLDDRGLTGLQAVQSYGNFADATFSNLVQTIIDEKITTAKASVVVRDKSQYWLFFSDGTGLIAGFKGNKLIGFTTFDFKQNVSTVFEGEMSDGSTGVFFGCDDGYLYRINKGNSLDGSVLEHALVFPYYHYGTPSQDKQYRKLFAEIEYEGPATIYVQVDFSYGSADVKLPDTQSVTVQGASGQYGVDYWNQFLWQGQIISTDGIDIDGEGENMAIWLYGNSSTSAPHKVTGFRVQYSLRQLLR